MYYHFHCRFSTQIQSIFNMISTRSAWGQTYSHGQEAFNLKNNMCIEERHETTVAAEQIGAGKQSVNFSKPQKIFQQSTQKKPHSLRIDKTSSPRPQHGWYTTFSTDALTGRLTRLRSPCNDNEGKSQHPTNKSARLQGTTRQLQRLDERKKNKIGRACE